MVIGFSFVLLVLKLNLNIPVVECIIFFVSTNQHKSYTRMLGYMYYWQWHLFQYTNLLLSITGFILFIVRVLFLQYCLKIVACQSMFSCSMYNKREISHLIRVKKKSHFKEFSIKNAGSKLCECVFRFPNRLKPLDRF